MWDGFEVLRLKDWEGETSRGWKLMWTESNQVNRNKHLAQGTPWGQATKAKKGKKGRHRTE